MKNIKRPARIFPNILIRVLPVAALVLLAIWFTTLVIAARAVHREVDERLATQAVQAAEATSRKLMTLIDTVRGLALNDLLVNSLIDTVYRSNYLPLFFQSLRIPGPAEVQITMTDYRGRGIVSNSGDMITYEQAPWLAEAMEGREVFQLSLKGLRIAMPVLYSGLPEGVFVIEYDTEQIFEILAISSQTGAFAILDSTGDVLFVSEHAPGELGGSDSSADIPGWIVKRNTIPEFPGILLISAEPVETAFGPQHNLDRYLLLAMLLDLLALFVGISLTARSVTKPLSTFIHHLNEIGHSYQPEGTDYRVPEVGPAEFHLLAQSFNTLFEELQKTTVSRDQLETLVHERTRELEGTQQELVSNAFLNAFLTGMAANSGMVLHNIGNAITPMKIQVEGMNARELKQVADYLEKCYADLQENAHDLTRYVTDDPRGKEVFAHLGKLIHFFMEHEERQSHSIRKMDDTLSYISDILTLQQVYGASRQEIEEQTDLNRVLEDAIRMQAGTLKKRGITVKKDLEVNLPELLIDKNRLMQVIVNFIKNSYEAIDERNSHNAEKMISVKSFVNNGLVGFEITDTGIGINPEQIDTFLELEKSGKGSSGFGLYFCKMFVEANKGTLSITSPGKGKGATVFVSFEI